MKAIKLHVNGTTIELNTHEVNGKTLYKAQDLLRGYGMDSRKANDTIRNWKESLITKSLRKLENSGTVEFTVPENGSVRENRVLGQTLEDEAKAKVEALLVVVRGGKHQGTYLTERQIYKLAGYVDGDFEDAVYEAFEALVHGDTEKALAITGSVAEIHEIMLSKRPMAKIAKMHAQYGYPRINLFVKEFLFGKASRNFNASKADRMRLANSFRLYIKQYYNSLHGEAAAEARADVIEADATANNYRLRRHSQYVSFQRTRAQKAITQHVAVMRHNVQTLSAFGI
ncbi:hypothetical protein [Edwardsiella tarda]|uniref:hypothetical protein n=1 Tax=Edwardsiella tarda TaxID=636 RepID=UPI00083B7628|nr:hypothetical protein [Edwardsiella tarda]